MIPLWTMAGVLPPIRPGQLGHSTDRSPYCVSLEQVVDRFSLTSERNKILDGLLKYRAALHQMGLVSGFQWLDGSFMENIEVMESRPPKDIDVVTYAYLPAGETQQTLDAKAGQLFDHAHVKQTYFVDAYPQFLGQPMTPPNVKKVSYWYSMWAHRRDGLWKGFIQVDLDPSEDSAARLLLDEAMTGGQIP